jgi:acyl-coenzyme A synthetase/AMP-(fatty) acid ligase
MASGQASPYASPLRIAFIDELPRTGLAKIDATSFAS